MLGWMAGGLSLADLSEAMKIQQMQKADRLISTGANQNNIGSMGSALSAMQKPMQQQMPMQQNQGMNKAYTGYGWTNDPYLGNTPKQEMVSREIQPAPAPQHKGWGDIYSRMNRTGVDVSDWYDPKGIRINYYSPVPFGMQMGAKNLGSLGMSQNQGGYNAY